MQSRAQWVCIQLQVACRATFTEAGRVPEAASDRLPAEAQRNGVDIHMAKHQCLRHNQAPNILHAALTHTAHKGRLRGPGRHTVPAVQAGSPVAAACLRRVTCSSHTGQSDVLIFSVLLRSPAHPLRRAKRARPHAARIMGIELLQDQNVRTVLRASWRCILRKMTIWSNSKRPQVAPVTLRVWALIVTPRLSPVQG